MAAEHVESIFGPMPFRQPSHWKRQVLALVLFSAAFGYLEAAVVSYLRYLQDPMRHRFYPLRPAGELFPLLTADQAALGGPQQRKVFFTEIGRETATIIMLSAVALTVATNMGHWAAAFAVAFGAWDITFYLFLKVLLNWPASLFTWDILFIVPVPWVAPVIAPILVSAAMILAGAWHLRRETMANPPRLSARNWVCIVAGSGRDPNLIHPGFGKRSSRWHAPSIRVAGFCHRDGDWINRLRRSRPEGRKPKTTDPDSLTGRGSRP